MTRWSPKASEAAVIVLLGAASFAASSIAMRAFRAAGIQPFFYQQNFEPAVMMACGRGFGVSSPTPPALVDFLQVRRNDFDCALFSASTRRLPPTLTANANWYYLYGTAAGVWRLTGVSWTALDVVVSAMGAVVTVLLYGLFRLVAVPAVAAAVALVLTLSPANATELLSMRDYSKAPFVLAAVLILAVLVMRPMRQSAALALAALYGAVVGVGYGFRGDLAVMVPFGVFVVLLLLPGRWPSSLRRNGLAAAALLCAFVLVAWPVLSGLDKGGCQYHFALLGLTEPLTAALHLSPPLYRLSDHLLDIFGNLKVGDYASRVMHAPVPVWCTAEFDTASAPLYMKLATTFPADFVVRAYASVLMILRQGLEIPKVMPRVEPFPHLPVVGGFYWTLHAVTAALAPFGVLITLAAIGAAWASSARLGAALTVFVLFLTGYPAIRFEERHWFHLRFIPWWAAMAVGSLIISHGLRGWPRPLMKHALLGVCGVLGALIIALGALRVVQARTVGNLITSYAAAATKLIPTEADGGSRLRVAWQPHDYGTPPEHRGSDLVVITLEPAACQPTGTGPVTLTVKYAFDDERLGHDLSTAFSLERPPVGAEPTRVFVPVFWAGLQDHTYLRFAGIEVVGAPIACVGRVARVVNGASLPLWVEMQVPPDWSERRLYQAIAPPGLVKWLVRRPL